MTKDMKLSELADEAIALLEGLPRNVKVDEHRSAFSIGNNKRLRILTILTVLRDSTDRNAVLEEAASYCDDKATFLAEATSENHPDRKMRHYAIGALAAASDGIRRLKSSPTNPNDQGSQP